jgi:hypothetical protein
MLVPDKYKSLLTTSPLPIVTLAPLRASNAMVGTAKITIRRNISQETTDLREILLTIYVNLRRLRQLIRGKAEAGWSPDNISNVLAHIYILL